MFLYLIYLLNYKNRRKIVFGEKRNVYFLNTKIYRIQWKYWKSGIMKYTYENAVKKVSLLVSNSVQQDRLCDWYLDSEVRLLTLTKCCVDFIVHAPVVWLGSIPRAGHPRHDSRYRVTASLTRMQKKQCLTRWQEFLKWLFPFVRFCTIMYVCCVVVSTVSTCTLCDRSRTRRCGRLLKIAGTLYLLCDRSNGRLLKMAGTL